MISTSSAAPTDDKSYLEPSKDENIASCSYSENNNNNNNRESLQSELHEAGQTSTMDDQDDRQNSEEKAERKKEAKCFGQLVLSVDLAPTSQLCFTSGSKLKRGVKIPYQVELSLCMKQQQDNEQNCQNNNNSSNLSSRKRELVYERFDRFPWPIEPSSSPSLEDKAADSTQIELPFKEKTFDAGFCFNLLNARMANIHDDYPELAEQMISKQRIDLIERNWLEMEDLSTKLRVDFLHELAKLVKANGKFGDFGVGLRFEFLGRHIDQ